MPSHIFRLQVVYDCRIQQILLSSWCLPFYGGFIYYICSLVSGEKFSDKGLIIKHQ